MSQREHAEDTVWWSIKSATEFAAHRRTVVLFHTYNNISSTVSGETILIPNPLTWIDNTGEVWHELRSNLTLLNPQRIAINIDENFAFAGGLHVGELAVLHKELGTEWISRFVNEPMLAIEFVAKSVVLSDQIRYFRRMSETVWAMIEEAFSARVVRPGKTTTDVSRRKRFGD